MKIMKLSTNYKAIPLYAIVYHTSDDHPDEVGLVANRFFKSEHKAWRWFNKNRYEDGYKQVEVVQVTNFGTLTFEKPALPY
jgi:hypothetical protein